MKVSCGPFLADGLIVLDEINCASASPLMWLILQVVDGDFYESSYNNTEPITCAFFLPVNRSDGGRVADFTVQTIGMDR